MFPLLQPNSAPGINILINLIISRYYNNSRCLIYFTDNNTTLFPTKIPTIQIYVTQNNIQPDIIFNSFGCQGVIIYARNISGILSNFEREIRLHNDRFNYRRYLFVPTDFDKFDTEEFFGLTELDNICDLVLLQPIPKRNCSLIEHSDEIFEIKTHKYVGTENNNHPMVLDKWFMGNTSFLYGVNLFPDKMKNQLGRPLKLATLPFQPYSIVDGKFFFKRGNSGR